MSQHYSEPSREQDPYALPDVEVFHVTASEFVNADEQTWLYERMTDDRDVDADDLAGWYYWYCFPGCLPESEPRGPYESEQAAIDAAREDNE